MYMLLSDVSWNSESNIDKQRIHIYKLRIRRSELPPIQIRALYRATRLRELSCLYVERNFSRVRRQLLRYLLLLLKHEQYGLI